MSPARRFKHQAIGVDLRKARICVGLQNSTEVCQMLLRVLTVAIGAVSEPDRRRDITRGWSLIAHIRPQPGGLGLAASGCQYRKRRIVGVHNIGGKD